MKAKLLDKISEVTESFFEIEVSDYDKRNLCSMKQHIAELPDNSTKPIDCTQYESLMDKANRLEIEFEHTHPRISKSMSEIVKILSDMGI